MWKTLRKLQNSVKALYVEPGTVQETKTESDDETEGTLRPFLSDCNACVSHTIGLSAGFFLFLGTSLFVKHLVTMWTLKDDIYAAILCCTVCHGE